MTESIQTTQARLRAQISPGARVRIRQKVRIGSLSWPVEVTGVVREIELIATGIHTARVPADDIWVASILLEKADGELSRITFDENSRVEVLPG